jgi:dephospho-CoA kinase
VTFAALLARYPRLAITGGPKTGKTTLSNTANDRRVVHGDDRIDLGWSESSLAMARDVNEWPGPIVIEGVQVPRALRKGMRVDAVLWLSTPRVPLTSAQAAMAKGVQTVFDEWRAQNPHVPVIFGVDEHTIEQV